MVGKQNIRDYEVSIWTLQDSFITVLKASNLEKKGDIENPQMVLKDDGENTLSFKIPCIYESYEIYSFDFNLFISFVSRLTT